MLGKIIAAGGALAITSVAPLAQALALECFEDSEVHVSFDVRGGISASISGEAISSEIRGEWSIYGRFPGPDREIVLMLIGDDVLYEEVEDGTISFIGDISDALIVPEIGQGQARTFSFRAVDGDEVRIIENGRVTRIACTPTRPSPGTGGGGGGGGGGNVYYHSSGSSCDYHDTRDEGGCGGSDDSPSSDNSSCEGDTYDDDESSGCESDSGSSSSSSESGCEGDTGDDSASKACDGDDEYAAASRMRRRGQSMFNLVWPIAVAGVFNRLQRRKRS